MKSKSLYNSSTRNADYGSPFNAKVKSILRFDKLHLMKLLEISQYSFVGFLLGYVLSKYINDYLLIDYDISNYINEDYPKGHLNRNPKLLLHVGWDLLINVISIYYIVIGCIIFIFVDLCIVFELVYLYIVFVFINFCTVFILVDILVIFVFAYFCIVLVFIFSESYSLITESHYYQL